MADHMMTNDSRERAVTTNHFDRGKRYSYKIENGFLNFKRSSAPWSPLRLPSGESAVRVAADNNRVLVLASSGKLYWRCLLPDAANWVILVLKVAEFLGITPLKDSLWKMVADPPDQKGWIEERPPDDEDLARWAKDYQDWARVTHDPRRDEHKQDYEATLLDRPYIKENGWNSLEFRSGLEEHDILDIAVGHWDNTVVTYYVLARSKENGGVQLYFIDEEPIMHYWWEVPPKNGTLNGGSRISASHSVIAVATGRELHWTRIDAHRPGIVDIWPLNWTETWSPDLKHQDLLLAPFQGQRPPLSIPQTADPVQKLLLATPPFDVLNADNYPGWHSVTLDVEAVNGFIIDVGIDGGPWPVPSPGLFPRLPIIELTKIFSLLWWVHILVAAISETMEALEGSAGDKKVGFLGENPIKPNSAYPVSCIVESNGRHRGFIIPSASKAAEIEWLDVLPAPQTSTPRFQSYTGNQRTKELHISSCVWRKKIKRNNVVDYFSLKSAANDGYNGCYYCMPEIDTDRGQ